MIMPVFFMLLGVAATAFGISCVLNIRGISSALSQQAKARSERVYRGLGGQGTIGGFDGLGTPAGLAAGTSILRYRVLGALLTLVGPILCFASYMILSH
ncbi:hypothetical protein AB0F13_20775 [Streptomyces sp. NPDC026206]|uniref:hypothetical protein n=1 Tax=Streptomyces sp. NPDC026206 TaxID=3157089 RepID=UPI0033DEC37B